MSAQVSSPTPSVTADVAVIGAGPVGLFTVFQCGMLGLSCVVVDSLEAVGGQCSALYPEKPIYDIPACPAIQASDLIARLSAQSAPFDPTFLLSEEVITLEGSAEAGFLLETAAGTRIAARAVVIAVGAGAFGPNRPPLDNLAAFEGQSVFYWVREKEQFRDRRVVIAGGGDSAVDWALSLAEVAASVQVVHRRDRFRAAPESVRQLHALVEKGQVELVSPYNLHGLEGQDGRLEAVTVATLDGDQRRLLADVLLPLFGLATDLGPVARWGLEMHRTHIVVDPTTAATSRPGVYAVGDVCTYPHKRKLILTGFAEAAQAAHALFTVARPGEALHFEHSTTRGLPGEGR